MKTTLPQTSDRPGAERTPWGLIAWLNATRLRLPLQEVEASFLVSGDIMSVSMCQRFYQGNPEPLNCQYSFPLPAGAAVHHCEIRIGSRTITAVVKERKTARAEFEAALNSGHRAGLVESQRENFFTLDLGNLQPQDEVAVELKYFQKVDRLENDLSFHIPTCPGVRYIAGKPLQEGGAQGRGTREDTDLVPDASKISPPRISGDHEDVASLHIEGHIENPNLKPGTLKAALHPIRITPGGAGVKIALKDDESVPDCDFRLSWAEEQGTSTRSQAWRCTQNGETYALVRLVAPAERNPTVKEENEDYYFMVDRSGSMEGAKWTKTVEALERFISWLKPDDRIWITFFESNYEDYADRPLRVSEVKKQGGLRNILEMGAEGGTQLLPACRHVLNKVIEFSNERRASIILITDGQAEPANAIVAAFKPFSKVTVHTFGIDTAVNDALLRSIARQQRGQTAFHTPEDDIAGSVEKLARRLRQAIITDIQTGPGWQVANRPVADLYANDTLLLHLKQTEDQPLVIRGIEGGSTPYQLRIDVLESQNPAIAKLWAKEQITTLMEEGQSDAATQLSIASNILCGTTSFIAVDSTEKVVNAHKNIYQPSLEPRFLSSADWMEDQGGMAASACWASLGPAPDMSMSVSRMSFFKAPTGGPGKVFLRPGGTMDLTKGAPKRELPGKQPWFQELRSLGFHKVPGGKHWLRELRRWVDEAPVARTLLVRGLISILQGKSSQEWQALCVKFVEENASTDLALLEAAQAINSR